MGEAGWTSLDDLFGPLALGVSKLMQRGCQVVSEARCCPPSWSCQQQEPSAQGTNGLQHGYMVVFQQEPTSKKEGRDFPGIPVAKTPCSNCRGPRFDLWSGNWIPHMCVLSCFSCVRLFVSPWTVALQAPLSMGFSRQEYWSGLPFPSPRSHVPQLKIPQATNED